MSDIVKNPYFYPTEGNKEPDAIPLQTFEKEEEISGELVEGLTSIIIPAYFNSYPVFHQTGHCIGSIREHTDKAKTPYEIILVLNGTKSSIKFDKYELTYADKVIPLEENEGYAKAVNKGIRASQGENICIMNNDVLVFDNWLNVFLEIVDLNHESRLDLVMATPMYGMPYARATEAKELAAKYDGKFLSSTYSDFRDFSCVLAKRKLFDEIGLFNEEFFMYGEDLDFLRRMDKAEKKYASTRAVNTYHIIGMTSSSMDKTPQIMNESREKLKQIWGY